MKSKKNLIRNLFIFLIIIYVIYTLINQQVLLNEYNEKQAQVSIELTEIQQENEELLLTQEQVDSSEFIEETAREKLDMYYPNETIYIGI